MWTFINPFRTEEQAAAGKRAQQALNELLERYPRLRPSPRGFNYRSTSSFRGLAEYWVHE